MRIVDKLILALTRGGRHRRRELELGQPRLPGIEGYYQADSLPEAHTAARGGLSEPSRGLLASRSKGVRMAVAAVVVAGGIGLPSYIAGSSMAAAGATEAAYEAAFSDYDDALVQEASSLDIAVAAYSAEREATGEALPEDVAASRIREAHPKWSGAEVAGEVDSGASLVLSYTERAAVEMFRAEPPATETARESIQAYEAAEAAAYAAEREKDSARKDRR